MSRVLLVLNSKANRERVRERLLDYIEYDTAGGCWLWSRGVNRLGYGHISVGGRSMLAHRASYAVFCEPIPKGTGDKTGSVVMHKCDVPACINPAHLRLGSQRENIADRHSKGRTRTDLTRQGERHPMAKLDEARVRAIRADMAAGKRRRRVAEAYGVSESLISMIVKRQAWGHII